MKYFSSAPLCQIMISNNKAEVVAEKVQFRPHHRESRLQQYTVIWSAAVQYLIYSAKWSQCWVNLPSYTIEEK